MSSISPYEKKTNKICIQSALRCQSIVRTLQHEQQEELTYSARRHVGDATVWRSDARAERRDGAVLVQPWRRAGRAGVARLRGPEMSKEGVQPSRGAPARRRAYRMRPAGRWRGARDGGGARVGSAELAEAGTAIGRRGQRGRGGGGVGRDRREDRGRSWRRLAARRGEGSEGAAAAGETDARAEGGARAAASAQAGRRHEQDGERDGEELPI